MIRRLPLIALLLAAPQAWAATPIPSLDPHHGGIPRVTIPTSAKSPILQVEPYEPAEPVWRFGIHYFQGTANSLGDVFTGSYDVLAQNGLRFTAARVLTRDIWNTPIDVLLEGGIMWHDEKGKQDDTFQYTLGVKFEWDEFPWNDHLRTRIGFTTGLSYADQIPIAEQVNRGTTSSSHLLHYLDFSLAFNCGDISRLTRLEKLFPGGDARSIDNFWLTVGVPHRSGAWGTYGDDRTGEPITGGSNYLSIGIEADF